MAAANRPPWLERGARIAFGVVVVPLFAGLALLAALARFDPQPTRSALPDLVLAVVVVVPGLIAAYGLDQLLAGIRPSRRRWFRNLEERLVHALGNARGSATVARLWGAPLRVHWSALAGLLLLGGVQPGAWVGFLAVVLAHEFGHAVLVHRFGHRIVGLSLHALGGECSWTGQPTPLRRALIAWGGVAGQAVLLAVAWTAAHWMPALFTGWFGRPLGHALVESNLAMAALNLLPLAPLDGAEAWRVLSLARTAASAPPRDAVEAVVKTALERARRGRDR